MIELAGALIAAAVACYYLWIKGDQEIAWIAAAVLCAAGQVLTLASLT